MNVLDASALLAYLGGEPGAAYVQELLDAGHNACGAANWSEVAQKVEAHGRDWSLAAILLDSYGLVVDPVTRADAEWAASRWRAGEGLSLGDRCCLALADRLDATAVTADARWGEGGGVRQIR